MELQARTIEMVSDRRRQVTEATRLAASGPISGVLDRVDIPYTYVVKVLDVHPCLGKVAGRRLLDELGIAHRTRLGELVPDNRVAIEQACGCRHA